MFAHFFFNYIFCQPYFVCAFQNKIWVTELGNPYYLVKKNLKAHALSPLNNEARYRAPSPSNQSHGGTINIIVPTLIPTPMFYIPLNMKQSGGSHLIPISCMEKQDFLSSQP